MLVELVRDVLQPLLLHEAAGDEAVVTQLELVHRGELVIPATAPIIIIILITLSKLCYK